MPDRHEPYPTPPFPAQQQPWPALACRMQPPPDHGETSYVGHGRLAGRKALVTGGDSGIGRAVAIAFAREGADVAINYLPQEEEDAAAVVALIEQAGRKAVALPGDLRDAAFCRRLVDDAAKGLGGLDILVNNAGRQTSFESIADIPDEHFDDIFKTNVYALFHITKAALRHLGKGAAIINTSSVQAFDPSGELFDYAATKAAVLSFTRSLAKQLGKKGIRVNAVAPGPYWTPLQLGGGQPMDKLVKFGQSTPLGRPGQPAEIAAQYVQLASHESSFTTGNVWGSTGGETGP
jgi:NAD(P)-dependent dehydrogenase (short-subunit alcohol dehydrogenase family)